MTNNSILLYTFICLHFLQACHTSKELQFADTKEYYNWQLEEVDHLKIFIQAFSPNLVDTINEQDVFYSVDLINLKPEHRIEDIRFGPFILDDSNGFSQYMLNLAPYYNARLPVYVNGQFWDSIFIVPPLQLTEVSHYHLNQDISFSWTPYNGTSNIYLFGFASMSDSLYRNEQWIADNGSFTLDKQFWYGFPKNTLASLNVTRIHIVKKKFRNSPIYISQQTSAHLSVFDESLNSN